ncbi:cytochrome P450 [Fomitiporia mediterranea MF3/22]|uniref:cytochrome P450 n=1 Tax=Fomitiporia mediterranea (strain MF3/22) TaxID=694068 RepID=UPI0004407AEA|nr:cytochrome P450 [Fomitiporia mediterranea MF3/22]EJD06677.1 cytochrome P450 [Fomitiporia mediterranea MF3/22]
MYLVWDIAAATLAVSFTYFLYSRGHSVTLHLPPSPPKDFLIGHARKIPFVRGWEVYAKWKEDYGDVIYTQAFGRSIVVLNSLVAARDLLEKRSNVFSDRPYLPVVYEMGWEFALSLLRYGPRFRKQRRIYHQYFNPQAISAFSPTRDRELRKFLQHLVSSPDNFFMHIRRQVILFFISGMIVSITYGHEVVTEPDPFVEFIEEAMHALISSGNFGTTILDVFPFMRYAPSWLPGMGVKRLIPRARALTDRVMLGPLEELKAKREKGIILSCIMSDLLNQYEEMDTTDPDHEIDIMNVGLTVYAAGSDTTSSTLKAFFLLMTIHSDVAKKVQEEIDRVVGRDRLPRIEDRGDLPYLDCVLRELYRIHPAVPLGLPHRSTKAEQYRGWTIPAGSMIVANIWYMMRDEKIFPDPESFVPERHMANVMASLDVRSEELAEGVSASTDDDPSSMVFGFGRRICPGKYLADTTLWLTVATVLALFDISPYIDPKTGMVEVPKLELNSDGVIVHPNTFKCTIVPRRDREQVETMIMGL